jgi:ornithine cyclodeaminase
VAAAHVTDVRTGAASGAATRALARTESRHLAILGTGRQALTQLQGILAVLPIERVSVWNRTAANAEAWIERVSALFGPDAPELELRASPEEAVRDADVVVTCTRAEAPVLRGEWLRPGTHVNAVGAGHSGQRELEPSVLRRAAVRTVDSRDLALLTGDFAGPLASGLVSREEIGELGEVLLGRRPGRGNDEEITLFKSVGHAANDLAVARHVAARARTLGQGVSVEM